MAQHNCRTTGCGNKASGRNLFCKICWGRIPKSLQETIRNGTEKGEHTLRARPTSEWMSRAIKSAMPSKKNAVAA